MINQQRIDAIRNARKLEDISKSILSADQRYKALDKTSVTLDVVKEYKMAQLKELCQEDIYGGFTHAVNGIEYSFSFDAEAQANFTGTVVTLTAGLTTSIPEWTVKLNGQYTRINMTYEQFKEVAMSGFYIKDQKIARLRNQLEPALKAAIGLAEIDAINW